MNMLTSVFLVTLTFTLATATLNNDIWSRLKGTAVKALQDHGGEMNDVINNVKEKVQDAKEKYEDHLGDGDHLGDEESKEDRPRPRRCCLPTHMQGKMAFQTDVDLKSRGMFAVGTYVPRFAMCQKRKMFVMDEIVVSKKYRYNITNIIDMNKKVVYIIDRAKKTCKKYNIKNMDDELSDGLNKPCIPKAARFMGPAFLGAGRHSLRVEGWGLHLVKKPKYDLRVISAVEPFGCIPVNRMVVGNVNGTDIVSTANFMDIRTRIFNPRIFDIPAICKKAEEVDLSAFTNNGKQAISHFGY